MQWVTNGADISYDVEATNGGLCYDRVRIHISDPEFMVELSGVDTELKAQIIITEVVANG